MEKRESSELPKTSRKQAEELLRANPSEVPTVPMNYAQALIQELNVHQMELEIQIEELRQDQAKVAKSRDHYFDLYDSAPVGYLTLDENGQIVEANLAAATLLRVEPHGLIGTKLSSFVSYQAQNDFCLYRQAVVGTNTTQVCEMNMQRSDGTPLVVRLESIVHTAHNERHCRTMLIEVTNLRHARQQLQASEQRYRRLTEAVTDYIYRVRIEHGRPVETVHGANCEAVTGYTPEEFAANPMLWIEMVPPDDRPAVERQAACILSGQDTPPIEHRIRRKDGQLRWALNTISPQHDAQGHLIAYDGLLRDITEQKQAGEAVQRRNTILEQRVDAGNADLRLRTDQLAHQSAELEKREHEFRMLADNVPALFAYVDREQRYRFVNRRYENLFQQPAGDIIGKTVAELLGAQQFEVVRRHVDTVLQGKAVTYEAEIDFGHDRRTIHASYVPDLDEEGQLQGFFALVSDVTPLKRAEQQGKLLAEAMSYLGEGVVITDDDLDWPGPRIRFVNEAMCRITGYKAEELIGQTPRILQGKETDRRTRDLIKRDLSAGQPCLVELVNYRKDGTPYDAELFITPLVDSKGRRTNFVAVHRDISARKETETALRHSKERMHAVLSTAADAIITIDRSGIVDDVNPATERMFGFTRRELVGRNVSMLMPQPYCDEHDEYIARYLRTRDARIIGIGREVVGRRKNGTTFPIDLAVSEVEHLGLFTGIIRDISDRKELQGEVLRVVEEEQRRVGQELHDTVQQELTGLGLLAQNLADRLAAGMLPDVEQVERVARGISETNRNVRMLARGLVPVEVDPQGLTSALAELAARSSQLYGLDCQFEYDKPVELADGMTATQLYRIAQEAVTNVVKHSRADRLRIHLASQGSRLCLRVIDNGIGINEKRGDRHGTGLHIMAYRAGLIGGTVQVTSGQPSGTVVTCTVLTSNN